MFRNGLRALREIADYWEYLTRIGSLSECEKSMKSLLEFWKEKHSGFNYSVKPRVGDFYWIEYGNNLDPEMSYEHMGIIIKINNRLLYTIPITTPKNNNPLHRNAFHPIDNPSGNKSFIKLKKTDFPFLRHDSLAKVSEIKPVSIKRLGRKVYHLDVSNYLIREIINLSHQNSFDDFDFEINKLKKENSLLKLKLELAKIPNMITDISMVNIDASFNLEIIQKSNNAIEIKLTDKYGQSETKIINIKQDE